MKTKCLASSSVFKRIGLVAFISSAVFLGQCVYDGYQRSTTPSLYERAAQNMQFIGIQEPNLVVQASAQQEALLTAFYCAGYFELQSLWSDLVHMGFKDPEVAFQSIAKVVLRSGAGKKIGAFNAKLLRKNLFDASTMNEADALDLLLYWAQKAFGRVEGQERYQVTGQNWMVVHKELYMDAATKLGLIKRILPKHRDYREAWIAGASRGGLLLRLVDYNYMLPSIRVDGATRVLAGERPLWAEIDGIDPTVLQRLEGFLQNRGNLDDWPSMGGVGAKDKAIQEGKDYLMRLAQRHHIRLDPLHPLVCYGAKEVCPPRFLPHRTYPNYINPNGVILTETIMAQDMLNSYMRGLRKQSIVDTPLTHGARPDTQTTARDAARQLAEQIQYDNLKGGCKTYVVYFQSNQPYVLRQALVTQREIDYVLQEKGLHGITVKVDGVGCSSKQGVATIHSELGAWVYELYLNAQARGTAVSRRSIKELQFTTRDQRMVTAPLPAIELGAYESYRLTAWFQDWFDKKLA